VAEDFEESRGRTKKEEKINIYYKIGDPIGYSYY
jgi:hypothetical protein